MAAVHRQPRRSVSITEEVFFKIKEHCEEEGISMSKFVEDRVWEFFSDEELREAITAEALERQ